ncbi:MAG: hypothetical protein ACOC3B_02985 [Bacillota bacterium]
MEDDVKKWLKEHDCMLSDHEVRISNVEQKTGGQTETIKDLAKKIDTLTYAIGAGMLSIILMLIPILISLL